MDVGSSDVGEAECSAEDAVSGSGDAEDSDDVAVCATDYSAVVMDKSYSASRKSYVKFLSKGSGERRRGGC